MPEKGSKKCHKDSHNMRFLYSKASQQLYIDVHRNKRSAIKSISFTTSERKNDLNTTSLLAEQICLVHFIASQMSVTMNANKSSDGKLTSSANYTASDFITIDFTVDATNTYRKHRYDVIVIRPCETLFKVIMIEVGS